MPRAHAGGDFLAPAYMVCSCVETFRFALIGDTAGEDSPGGSGVQLDGHGVDWTNVFIP